MRESIYTIPVNDVFGPKCGCPLCTMRDILELRCVDYIMGAAMMEPDTRIETNKLGFCKLHFDMMAKQKNRLSLALILESHLLEQLENHFKKTPTAQGGIFKKTVETPQETCFVCSRIEWAEERMIATMLKMYVQDESFRNLYNEQEHLCLKHYDKIMIEATKKLDKKYQKAFFEDTRKLCENYLQDLSSDVSKYCKMFDYRNSAGKGDWGTSKDSIERAIKFLTTREVNN